MTISSTTNRKEYTGNGVTTSFSFPYRVLEAGDLKVYQNGTLKTLTTHYTLSGTAPYDSGTDVQFLSAPAADDEIVILRDPAATQTLDLVENDPLPADELEKGYDRLTMLVQRLIERVDRVFRLADTDVSGASVTVPTPQPNQVLGWNSDGTALVNTTALTGGYVVSPFAATVLDDTTAAAACATLGALQASLVSAFGLTLINDADAATARATLGLTYGPTFSAYAAADQTGISSGVITKVTLGTEEWDTASCFASSRFTPNVGGYYLITGTVKANSATMTECIAAIFKNGSLFHTGQADVFASTNASITAVVTAVVFLNGSTDYVELYGQVTGGTPKFAFTAAANTSRFSGCLLRPT